ncbi:type II toxin-antitoxin system HicA family toxin [Mammaliicoccus sciuri]|uniref:type II toxin-antitoxin system HicA family toxin n=1 Tax=Mammaliicoccus sciuri TaxID=1296 RepID=UPI001C6379CF|nr:type II toxin-antitoxin system HicA family toxin [Mammaliicoccus sciuri]QYG30076.1 type II toxin-antitoxin system HicA family toxin [Mammaliicoccus sciuri]
MPMKPREMEKLILKNGFELQEGRGKGGHRFYINPKTKQTTTIPFHSKELPKGLERAILKQTGLK